MTNRADQPAVSPALADSAAQPPRRRHRFARQHLVLAAMLALLVAMVVVALGVGRYPVSFGRVLAIVGGLVSGQQGDWTTVEWNTVVNTRLPRILAALLVGAALAEAGAAYQGIFRNPMASPDLLGVSAGACVGAAAGILMGLGSWGIQLCAFVMAVAAVAAALAIPHMFHNSSVLMLVLAGIVVSGLMNSILGLMKFVANPDSQLADIVFWTMGSLNSIKVANLSACAPVIVVCGLVVGLLRWRVNVLSLPDEQAHYLGTHAARLRTLIIACTTLMTASAVCLSGTIGWIGLVVPHMVRLVVGSDNRFVIPASVLVGALFLLVADTLSRTLSAMSVPLSIITGIVGAPLFVVLLLISGKAVKGR